MRTRAVLTFVGVAVVGICGLLVSAAADSRPTSFSLGIPASTLAPLLFPGQQVCQGPIDPPSAYGGVRAWIWPGFPPGAFLRVSVYPSDSGAVLATGPMAHTNSTKAQLYPTPQAASTAFVHTLPAGRRITICLRNTGTTAVSLMGAPATSVSGNLIVHGRRSRLALSLLFLKTHPPTLLSLVPTMFSRASLFRPTWVGAWTFWVLLVALLAVFPLAGLAVARASHAAAPSGDDRERPPPTWSA